MGIIVSTTLHRKSELTELEWKRSNGNICNRQKCNTSYYSKAYTEEDTKLHFQVESIFKLYNASLKSKKVTVAKIHANPHIT